MSNENLERYKKLYSEYIDHAVNVHNYHLVFINTLGLESGKTVRSSLKYMIRLERELQKASLDAYKEHRKQISDTLAKKREERAWRKANPKQPGRPKKEL